MYLYNGAAPAYLAVKKESERSERWGKSRGKVLKIVSRERTKTVGILQTSSLPREPSRGWFFGTNIIEFLP